MDFDFNLILVPATLGLFAVWLLDKLVFKQRKNKGKDNENTIITWAYDFWPVLGFVLVMRAFIVEPFNIPSSSMEPSLFTGDFILVNKYDYGIKLPLINKKIISTGTPKRGDVVVFRYPVNPKLYYIKRVVGVPGDTITFDNGTLSLNGKEFQKNLQAPEMINPILQERGVGKADLSSRSETMEAYVEDNGIKKYLTQYLIGYNTPNVYWVTGGKGQNVQNRTFVYKDLSIDEAKAQAGIYWQVTVPDKSYFMMGDNRDKSLDSRFWGFVPEENISGRAFYVWMHKEPGLHMPSFSQSRKIQ